jgi:hypothetical protein
VEGKLVKKVFLIEIAVLCAIVFLFALGERYPLFDSGIPGFYEGCGYALGILLPCWALLRLLEDRKSGSTLKWPMFLIRILVIYAAFGIASRVLLGN